MPETYYDILGISRKATAQEIKTAYRELAKNVHPDALPNASDFWRKKAEEEFKGIQEAYSVLSDPHKRKLYDEQLEQLTQPKTVPPQQTAQAASYQPPPAQTAPRPAQTVTPHVVRRWTGSAIIRYVGAVFGWFMLDVIFFGLVVGDHPSQDWRDTIVSLSVITVVISWLVALSHPLKQRKRRFPFAWCGGATVALLFIMAVVPNSTTNPSAQASAGAVSDNAASSNNSTSSFPCALGQAVSPIDNKPCPKQDQRASTVVVARNIGASSVANTQKAVKLDVQPLPQAPIKVAPERPGWNVRPGTSPPQRQTSLTAPPQPERQALSHEEVNAPVSGMPDLSCLTYDERQSIQLACLSAKVNQGPAAYDRCVIERFQSLGGGSRQPDLSNLSYDERQAIELACLSAKVNQGPAAFDRCVEEHLQTLGGASHEPDLSGLSYDERQSIQLTCLSAKVNQGPAAYDRCLTDQLRQLGH